jgi:hypothetical protein
MGLKEMSAAKEAGGKGETEKGQQSDAQKKRTHTTRQSTQTQPALLVADSPFSEALEGILGEDRCRTWEASRTIMLRGTSKRVKEVVDKMHLPVVVHLSRSLWDDTRNGTAADKLKIVMRQLKSMTAWCHITTLELPCCDMTGHDAESLAVVLAQCPALTHLDLSENGRFEAEGEEILAGVLGQCTSLDHLNLIYNHIGIVGNTLGPDGAERLAGVLGQCAALSHLNLLFNGTVGKGRLRASWRGRGGVRVRCSCEEEEEDPALLPKELAQLLRRC